MGCPCDWVRFERANNPAHLVSLQWFVTTDIILGLHESMLERGLTMSLKGNAAYLMMLSEIQVETYVAEGGVKCPHCGSPEIEASNQIFNEAGIFFDCACLTCLRTWKEHYELAGITPTEEGDERVHGTSN